MAVSTQEQKLLIKLVISMLGIAPGHTYMPVVEQVFEDLGHSLPDAASALAALPQFQARYPAGMAGDAFASQFLAGMGLQADAPLHRLAADLFNAGVPPQHIMLEAVLALASPGLPAQYAAARALLDNKAELAYYHAQVLGLGGTDFTALAKVLENVTQDPASVEAAKRALSPPPAPDAGGGGGPPPVFAVSKSVGDIASFTQAGTQIDVTEAGGTFTFTSSGGSLGTATLAGPLAGIIVPGGSNLSISSALAGSQAFSGAGTALVVANAAGEDLTAFAATGVTGFALTSGQNYTLTAAQAAIGRIGTGGAAGTLTDAGTTTVRDTLAALGGGVASALKAHGADSVIATAAPGDISGTTVAGIDSIFLAAGSYTMTAAQAALANGAMGTQVVTLTTQATAVLAASVESFVLGNFANSVTLGAPAQNVSSPAGTATTLAIAGTAPTGTWVLAHASNDTLVATDGANITGVNGGTATTAEKLTLTGGITMTGAQYNAFNAGGIAAAGGSDKITLTTALTGGQTLHAAVESFTLAAAGDHTLTLGAAQSIDAQALTAGQTLTLGGGFAASVALAGGNLSAASTTGNTTVTAGAGANTIALGSGADTVNAGGGADIITGGAGADTLNGEAGNDSFLYAAMADFLTGNLVVDRIDGGADTDAVVISGAIVLTTTSNLARMTTVEQLQAKAQSATQNAHSIVANTDASLSSLTTIDLSGDTKNTSTAVFNMQGVTRDLTLKGVGAGANSFHGGSGADTIVGGTGNDSFFIDNALYAANVSVTGGGGTDSVVFASTGGETLVVTDRFSSGLSYSITTGAAGTSTGTTSENINASTYTLGGVTLNGNAGNNSLTGTADADTLKGNGGDDVLRGGAGNDTINTFVGAGTTTYVFEANASSNGVDTLTGVRSGGTFDFRAFLGTGGVMKVAAVDSTSQAVGLDLTVGGNIGVRYGSSTLLNTDILLATNAGVAGEVAVADNGKVVVFSFGSPGTGGNANGSIYYVEDTNSAVGVQSFTVTLVGTMTLSSATIAQIATTGVYL